MNKMQESNQPKEDSKENGSNELKEKKKLKNQVFNNFIKITCQQFFLCIIRYFGNIC